MKTTSPKCFALSICLFFFYCTNLFAQSEQRTWTSANGKFEIEATLESFDETNVSLKKANGKVVKVPLAKLSKVDRKFLKDEAERSSLEQARIEEDKLNASKFDLLGVIRIGVPEDGFEWSKVENTPDSGGTMVSSVCEKKETDELIQLILHSQKLTDQNSRDAYAKDLFDGFIEGLKQHGFSEIRAQGPETDGRRKNVLVYRFSSKAPDGKAIHSVFKIKFGETTLMTTSFCDDPQRAMDLCDVIKTAKDQKGEKFEAALEKFRRFQLPKLGISIESPQADMNMDIVVLEATSMRLQSPGGAYIFVRTMNADEGADIDKGWQLMQRMAIPPNVKVDDEGDAKVDGKDARFKSYFHAPGGNKVWGTTWFIAGKGTFYVVTGMCEEGKKNTEGKALLNAIRGIKHLP